MKLYVFQHEVRNQYQIPLTLAILIMVPKAALTCVVTLNFFGCI